MGHSPAELAHGPFLIGGILTTFLFGISITQTYIYWNAYNKKDPWYIKYLVVLLLVSDAFHCVFIVIYLYDSVIRHFDDPSFLATSNWVFNTEPALSGMISGMVQTFFGWRVKLLTGSWFLFIVILICSIVAFLMGIATAIACTIVKMFIKFYTFQVVVIIWLVCATIADIIITTSLVIHLRRHKTGFKDTDSRIDRIIRMTVQTGLITAICAMVNLLFYLLGSGGTYLIFNCVLPKLYTNSLLSSLNSRGGLKYRDIDNTWMKQTQGDFNFRHFGIDSEISPQMLNSRPEVFVHVESREAVDPPAKAKTAVDGRIV